jgi:hypothetical protein
MEIHRLLTYIELLNTFDVSIIFNSMGMLLVKIGWTVDNLLWGELFMKISRLLA